MERLTSPRIIVISTNVWCFSNNNLQQSLQLYINFRRNPNSTLDCCLNVAWAFFSSPSFFISLIFSSPSFFISLVFLSPSFFYLPLFSSPSFFHLPLFSSPSFFYLPHFFISLFCHLPHFFHLPCLCHLSCCFYLPLFSSPSFFYLLFLISRFCHLPFTLCVGVYTVYKKFIKFKLQVTKYRLRRKFV